jgi:hypothetical protein
VTAPDEQRVRLAREYFEGIQRTGVEQLPPSRLMVEAAESRRQLRILLDVIDLAPEARQLAEIRAVLDAFDWEFDDRQYALEHIERITHGGAQ